MTQTFLKELNKKMPSEELARLLAENINILTLKRSVQISEHLKEERRQRMSKVINGLVEMEDE